MLVFRKQLCVVDDSIGLVEVGEQIQSSGSAIPSVRLVFYPHEGFLDGAQKLLTKGSVYVLKAVECKRGCIVIVADGRCFRSGGVCQDDGCCSGTGMGHDPCCQEGRIDSGGEGVVDVS